MLCPICNPRWYLKTSYLLITKKKKNVFFVNFKSNIISDLKKIISKKIKLELKAFKLESSKHLSESLILYKKQTNVRKECKSKDMIIAKLSRIIKNVTSKKTEVRSWNVQTNSNSSAKEPSLWHIMSELLSE